MNYQSDGTQVNTRPVPGAVTGIPGWVTGGNPATGLAASNDDPDVMNAILDELIAVIEAANIAPSKTVNTQLLAAIQYLLQSSGRFCTLTPIVASTTFVVPAGVYWIRASLVGGGGGGGACAYNSNLGGAGGGAGGFAMTCAAVTPGQSILCTVGAAGFGGLTNGNQATPGGTTSFGSFCSATGGQPGSGGGSFNSGGTGGLGYGTFGVAGGCGTDGQSGSLTLAGNGGASFFGGGGRGATGGSQPASQDGLAPGSGGGGAYNNQQTTLGNGGSGAPGVILMEY